MQPLHGADPRRPLDRGHRNGRRPPSAAICDVLEVERGACAIRVEDVRVAVRVEAERGDVAPVRPVVYDAVIRIGEREADRQAAAGGIGRAGVVADAAVRLRFARVGRLSSPRPLAGPYPHRVARPRSPPRHNTTGAVVSGARFANAPA
jgi:hypothetical protein